MRLRPALPTEPELPAASAVAAGPPRAFLFAGRVDAKLGRLSDSPALGLGCFECRLPGRVPAGLEMEPIPQFDIVAGLPTRRTLITTTLHGLLSLQGGILQRSHVLKLYM